MWRDCGEAWLLRIGNDRFGQRGGRHGQPGLRIYSNDYSRLRGRTEHGRGGVGQRWEGACEKAQEDENMGQYVTPHLRNYDWVD